MKNNVWFWIVGCIAALSLLLSACGQETPAETGGEEAAQEEEAAGGEEGAAEEGGEAASGEVTTSLAVEARGEQLLFDVDSLGPVPTGEEITLSFNNTSTINQHNWVLLNTNDEAELDAFDEEAAAVGPDGEYLPESDLIIAATSLLDPGAQGEVSFTAPEPGEYFYVCTVPGHYAAGMWGPLTVVE